jgi:glucose/arabinose dehydrogenase
MFINDVGQNAFEEINDGIGGSNYGWPESDGATSNPNHRSPLYFYGHGSTLMTGWAITGGAFYNPAVEQYPAEYVGRYFFATFRTWSDDGAQTHQVTIPASNTTFTARFRRSKN